MRKNFSQLIQMYCYSRYSDAFPFIAVHVIFVLRLAMDTFVLAMDTSFRILEAGCAHFPPASSRYRKPVIS